MKAPVRGLSIFAAALGLWSLGLGCWTFFPGPLSLRDITPAAQRRRPEPPRWPSRPFPFPATAFVSAMSDRARFFLGENPVVRLEVLNRGIMPFWIYEGGDYRGGTRAWRFTITVRDSRGQLLPDPMPVQAMMGGMGRAHYLRPRESHTYSALLSRYALIDRPGTYEVEVSHDLGTRRFPNDTRRPRIRGARFSLTFVEPTPEQAREIAARAGGLKWPARDSGSDSMIEYASLRFPVYLPFVEEALRRGEADAVQAFGHMRGELATERLAAWAGDAAATDAIRSGALLMLAARAPVPDPHWRSPHVMIAPAILREGAWNEDSRRVALAAARERVKFGFALAGDEASAAATLAGALGDASDADDLLALWRELMAKHRRPAGKGVSTERGPSGHSLVVALDQLRGRGWTLPFPVVDEGDRRLGLSFAELERVRGEDISAELRPILSALREHPEAGLRSRVEELLQSPASAPRSAGNSKAGRDGARR